MLIRHKRKLVAISASIALTTVLALETMSAHALSGASVTYTKDQEDLPVVSSVVTDVTSGSRYSANPGEIHELLLPDRTIITLSPGSQVTINTYAYDPSTGTGSITIQLERGALRIVGGRINDTRAVQIVVGETTLALERGSAFVDRSATGEIRTHLLVGKQLTVSVSGETVELVKPGFQVVVPAGGGAPSEPGRISAEQMLVDIKGLSTAGLSASGGEGGASGNSGKETGVALAANAGATESKSQGTVPPPPPPDASQSAPPPDPFRVSEIGDALGSASLGLGETIVAPTIDTNQPTDTSSIVAELPQTRVQISHAEDPTATPPIPEVRDFPNRDPGPTSNRVYNSLTPFEQVLNGSKQAPSRLGEDSQGRDQGNPGERSNDNLSGELEYVFVGAASTGAVFFLSPSPIPRVNSIVEGRFALAKSDLGELPNKKSRTRLLNNESAPMLEIFDIVGGVIRTEIKSPFGDSTVKFFHAGFLDVDPEDLAGDGAVDSQADRDKAIELRLVVDESGVWASNGLPDVMSARERANFLAVEVINVPVTEGSNERLFFAAGDIDRRTFDSGFSVDTFVARPGLDQDFEATPARAFLTQESLPSGLEIKASDTMVVNAATSDASLPSVLVHADFAANFGQRTQFKSTASLSLARVLYEQRTVEGGSLQEDWDAGVTGRTVASTRDNTDQVPVDASNPGAGELSTASRLYTSELFSTSSGSGNPEVAPNRAGYLVLENFDPRVEKNHPGGLEKPLDEANESQSYAFLRLAEGIKTEADNAVLRPEADSREPRTFNGYLAGLAEFQGNAGIGVRQKDTGATPDGLTISTMPATSRAAVKADFFDGQTVRLGQADGESAFINVRDYAARSSEGNDPAVDVGMISAGLVGLKPADVGADTVANAHIVDGYRHLQWGFFFGDTKVTAGQREHMHLGTWVAGARVEPANLPTTGSATYGGHSIGNVYNDGDLYTATGDFTNTWDFASRTGDVAMTFDGQGYQGSTALVGNSEVFTGNLQAVGRTGGIQGAFFGDAGVNVAPHAVGGQFSIQETAGPAYRAVGTFAGERAP